MGQADARAVRGVGRSRDSTDLFRLLVESVVDYAIFLLDPEGRVTSWNAGAERIKGYSSSEILGKHFSIFYPPEDIRHGKPEYALRTAADEGRWEEENWRIRKDGTRFWGHVVITALRGDDGQLVGFAKVTRDLTERKHAEEERAALLRAEREARARAEAAAERLTAVQMVTEAALAHLRLADLLTALLARIAEALAVDAVTVLLPQDGELIARAALGVDDELRRAIRVPLHDGFAGRIATDRQPAALEEADESEPLRNLVWSGKLKSVFGVPMIVEGRVVGVLLVGSHQHRSFKGGDVDLLRVVADRAALAIDHARLYEAERQARTEAEQAGQAVELREEFMSIASHELRTPLTSVLGLTGLLLRTIEQTGEIDGDVLVKRLTAIERQARRLNRLVSELFDTSRIESGKLTLDPTNVDLAQVVRSAVETLDHTVAGHRVRVETRGRVPVSADALRIEQVITNLIDNALKYGGPEEPVEVIVEPAGARARLVVRDHGPGIPPEARGRIFERFFRGHTRDHRSGLGLGLYISQQIVEQHHGSIEARFPPGGGTEFEVCLPLSPSSTAASTGQYRAG